MTHPTPQPRSDTSASRDIVIGATVYDQDNVRFGSVAGSYRNYLIVQRGFFMPVDFYVPMAVVERADRDLVVLTVSRDAALTQGWERPPFTSETGQRGLRQPAVGRPAAAPATPGVSVAAAGRQRVAAAGTDSTSWPAAAGDQASSPDSGTAPGGDRPVTQPAPSIPGPVDGAAPAGTDRPVAAGGPGQAREATAVSPSVAFADTYAIGTNTDSYHAFVDPNAGVGLAEAGQVASSPGEPVVGQPSGTELADEGAGLEREPGQDAAPGASSGETEGGNARPGK